MNDKENTLSATSDGQSATYYEIPEGCTQIQDLISYRDMNAQMGEIFRAVYRYGQSHHSSQLRDAKKIRFYIEAEIKRLETYCQAKDAPPEAQTALPHAHFQGQYQ